MSFALMLLMSATIGSIFGILYFSCICAYVLTRPNYTEKRRVHFEL